MCKSNISLCFKRRGFYTTFLIFSCGLHIGCGAIPIESKSLFSNTQQTLGKLTRDETAQTPPPNWVSNPPQAKNMVYAIGSAGIHYGRLAQAIKASKENARAEVLKNLIVTISNETQIETRRRVEHGKTNFKRELRDAIRSKAPETELRGLEIIEVYVDHAQKTVYTLARIDRGIMTSELRNQLADLDAQLDKFLAVPKNINATQQLKKLLPSLALLAYREKLEEQLRIVSGHSVVASPQKDALNRRINDLLDHLTIVLHPKGRTSQILEPHLTKYLTESGLRINSKGSADLLLEYRVSTRTVNDTGINFVYASGNIVIRNEQGRIINELDAQVKGGSPISENMARDKVVKQLGERLGEALRDSLLTRL
jgi:hypothetical protein